MAFREFEVDDTKVSEWLSWGALVRDGVMKNKDESFCAFIAYKPYEHVDAPNITNIRRDFVNGWSLWSEWQHCADFDRRVLTICWNPISGMLSSTIQNTLENDDAVEREYATDYFYDVVKSLAEELNEKTPAKVLTYQEIFDFLSFALAFDEEQVEMPSVPLFMDCLLSQDLDFEFRENDILLNNKVILPFSLPGTFESNILQSLFHAFEKVSFRFVERLLIFGAEEAQENFQKYTHAWANGRSTVKRTLLQHVLNELSGYYAKNFVFLLEDQTAERMKKFIQQCGNQLQIPYVIESYNLKDVWWGTLPGLFRANLTPPIIGFNSIESFLANPLYDFNQKADEEGGTDNVQAEAV